MNVRELWSALRDLPQSDSELDLYTDGGSKVTDVVVRNTPEEGPHVVLVMEHPADSQDNA